MMMAMPPFTLLEFGQQVIGSFDHDYRILPDFLRRDHFSKTDVFRSGVDLDLAEDKFSGVVVILFVSMTIVMSVAVIMTMPVAVIMIMPLAVIVTVTVVVRIGTYAFGLTDENVGQAAIFHDGVVG